MLYFSYAQQEDGLQHESEAWKNKPLVLVTNWDWILYTVTHLFDWILYTEIMDIDKKSSLFLSLIHPSTVFQPYAIIAENDSLHLLSSRLSRLWLVKETVQLAMGLLLNSK